MAASQRRHGNCQLQSSAYRGAIFIMRQWMMILTIMMAIRLPQEVKGFVLSTNYHNHNSLVPGNARIVVPVPAAGGSSTGSSCRFAKSSSKKGGNDDRMFGMEKDDEWNGLYDNVDDDDDDGDDDANGSAASFYDIDYEDDLDDNINNNRQLLSYWEDGTTTSSSLEGFERDAVDLLEEREDRLYIDEFGVKRKIETCILVGVENVSQRRKQERKHGKPTAADSDQQQQQPWMDSYDFYAPESTWNNNNHNNNGNDMTEKYDDDDDDDVYFTLEESLTEMRELVKTAGMEIVGEVTQRLNEVNPKTYIGSGKVKEADQLLKEKDCTTIVFDAELTPGQQKHLENSLNKKLIQNDFLVQEREIKVVDRTALILDIFAMHAKTREGKLQVDLALHEYRKPRLTRMWTHLERQSGAGGVGLRGPGESQLEIDKRLLRDRIITLKQKMDDVQKHRSMHRRGRSRLGLPILALVGYTNAGKSSVLNYLTKAGVMAESMLFATLDPTTRKVKLPGYQTHPEVLLTDTVGFIQKLPTHLVAAFRATLEEVQEADVLVHVIDVSNPSWMKQEKAVRSVLADIGAGHKPVVRVLNKIDLLDPLVAERLRYETPLLEHTVAVSATTGEGMANFVAVVEQALANLLRPLECIIPYSKGEELNTIHEQGNVEVLEYQEKGTYVKALVPKPVAERLARYSVATTVSSADHDPPPTSTTQQQVLPSTSTAQKTDFDSEEWKTLGRGRHRRGRR